MSMLMTSFTIEQDPTFGDADPITVKHDSDGIWITQGGDSIFMSEHEAVEHLRCALEAVVAEVEGR